MAMAEESSTTELQPLELDAVIGYAGKVPNGLLLHNDDKRILYGLGSTVVIKTLLENTQYFLQCGGSEAAVSCMALSKDGKLLATGQRTHPGFAANIWIWDIEKRQVLQRLKNLYKSKIQAVAFSPSGKYIATLGAEDNNDLIVWDVETGDPICGTPAANDTALCLAYANNNEHLLVTAGNYNFRVWNFDVKNRKLRPTDCKLGSIKRNFNCVTIDPTDEIAYAGTQSGDVLKISLTHTLFQLRGPSKAPFSLGVESVLLTKSGDIVVGAGDGTVALLKQKTLSVAKSIKVEGHVRSLALNAAGDHFFVGTSQSMIYLVALKDFDYELRNSAHFNRINDLCFAHDYSELFITAGVNDIRVWNSKSRSEMLRITVPNLECHCVRLSKDGSCIISGWNDGKVRAFYPQSGKLMYTIHNAHKGCVTALALSSDGSRLVTGGTDSNVRVWSIAKDEQVMMCSLKEHKNAISYIVINDDDTEFVTASHDGSCVVWDLLKQGRSRAMFASTQFSSILYHPDQSQFLTTGTDRQISYFDSSDCSTIRIIDGSESGAINSLSIQSEGEYFVSGGADRMVKLWHYDEGLQKAVGIGHSGVVTGVGIAPNGKYIVSTGDEGAIMLWKFPEIIEN